MEHINNRVEFWIDLWEDLIDNFLKKSYGLSLYSPQILIEDIITEIEEISFKNSENKKYLSAKLDWYFKNDSIIQKKFYASFKLLRKILFTNGNQYVLQTAKEINAKFKEGLYYNSCIEIISEELKMNEEISIEFVSRINYFSQSLIVEFLKKGYSLEDIKKFPGNIFDNYKIQKISGSDYLSTNYPHSIDYKNFIDSEGNFKREEFNIEVINFIANLTIDERINTLSHYFYKNKTKAKYIFVVEGLKGSVDIKIAGIEFYSLDKKRLITGSKNQHQEDLQSNGSEEDESDNEKFIQAAVEIDYLLPKSSLLTAVNKLENALDIISCYFKTSTPLETNTSNYVIVQNGEYIYSSWSRDKRDTFMKHADSLDLEDIKDLFAEINENSFLWDESDFKQKSKLLNAIHWFSKGEQSMRQEDKMLNYWIAIENLFNVDYDIIDPKNKSKINLIQEVISSTQLFTFIFSYGWELYHHYSHIAINTFGKRIPKDLIIKANLIPKVGEKIHLNKFIECLEEFKNYETNPFIISKIDDLLKFYNDKKETYKKISQQNVVIKEDILMIYRFRNLIVHNAYFDNTLLPYFIWKIRLYSSNLIRKMISEYGKKPDDLTSLLIRIHLQKEQFLTELVEGEVNLFR